MREDTYKNNKQGTLALRACPPILVYLLIFTILFSSLSTGYAEEYDGLMQYEGVQNYKALYNNVNFTDINNHWAKDSINRMSILSVTRGMGQSKYNPNGTVTREEALTLIIRLMGLESEAQLLAQSTVDNRDTGGVKLLVSSDYWADGYIQLARNTGIVTQDETKTIETLTDSEKESLEQTLANQMETYEDNESLTANQISNIRNQLQYKLEKRYTWKKPASREEVAVWVARTAGLSPITGQAQQMIYNMKDWNNVKIENLPLIEAVLQKGIMKGNEKGNFMPKSSLTRAEVATILDNIHLDTLANQGYNIKTGIVDRIDSSTQSMDGVTNKRKIFIIKNDDSSSLAITVQESDKEMYNRGFVAYKNGKAVLPSAILENDYIRYYINPEGQVVFVESLANKNSEIEGIIEEVNGAGNTIIIKDYYGRVHSFKIAEGVNVRVNDQWAKLEDLLYGQEATLKVNNGNVVDIHGYIDTGEPEYIHPGDRIAIGKVLYIDRKNGKVTLTNDDGQQEFIIDPFTPVVKNNTNVGINSIKEGDIIRLEFDQSKGNLPIKAYIAQPDRQIVNLYKAEIVGYNPNRNEIILENPVYYDNTKWNKSLGDTKLILSSDSNIYINGRGITKELLQSYLGREAYIATGDSFGKEEAIKVVFKSGYEKSYYNSIQDIAFGDSKIKVDYNEMYFDEGTIIIKDGKLIHPYNLKKDDDVFVISQGTDKYTASLISVEGIEDTGLVVYRGRIDDITQYGFELYGVDKIEGTDKDSSRRRTFDISDDTRIIDTRDDEIEDVSVEEFTNSRFLKDRSRRGEENYIREYVYAVGYGDMVLAIDIIDRNKQGQVITAANIKSVDREEDMITLKDIRDWNDFRQNWNINKAEINLDVKEALFIKNGKSVTLDEIRNSDSLYIIRRNDFGYIVICR